MKRSYPYLLTDPHPFWPGQAKALLCVAAATALRAAVDPAVEGGLYFTFVFPAVFVAGFWGGNRAAITAAVLGGILAGYLWIPPRFSVDIGKAGWVQLLIFAASASVQLFVIAIVNGLVQALENAQRQSAAMAGEMQHRSLNILALVQAVARQTFRSGGGVENQAAFEERIGALARSHQLLRDFGYDVVDLEKLLRQVIQPFDVARINLYGPACRIEGSKCASVAMLVHELATNAVKYGALSGDAGTVSITWKASDGEVQMVWQESGGPPVSQPTKTGAGSRLMKALLADETGVVFAQDGVSASIRVPLAAHRARAAREDDS